MLVVNGIISESISLIVISESSILFNGMFDEILNDSLRWITLTVFGTYIQRVNQTISLPIKFYCCKFDCISFN